MSLYTDSKSSVIVITTVHALLATLNIAGNSLVCVVIIKNQDMRYVKLFVWYCEHEMFAS